MIRPWLTGSCLRLSICSFYGNRLHHFKQTLPWKKQVWILAGWRRQVKLADKIFEILTPICFYDINKLEIAVGITALSLLQKKKQVLLMNSNNSLLEFIVDGTPQVKEYFLDSKKEVDKQLKFTCEQFISHCTLILIGPVKNFITKVCTYRIYVFLLFASFFSLMMHFILYLFKSDLYFLGLPNNWSIKGETRPGFIPTILRPTKRSLPVNPRDDGKS